MSKSDGGFPAYLRAALEAAGVTQAELARGADVKDSSVSRWLSGVNRPDVDQLRKLAGVLGVPVIDLVVASGHLTAEEAGMANHPQPPPMPVWSRQAIEDVLRVELGLAPELLDLVLNVLAVAWRGRDAIAHGSARTPDERNAAYLEALSAAKRDS